MPYLFTFIYDYQYYSLWLSQNWIVFWVHKQLSPAKPRFNLGWGFLVFGPERLPWNLSHHPVVEQGEHHEENAQKHITNVSM